MTGGSETTRQWDEIERLQKKVEGLQQQLEQKKREIEKLTESRMTTHASERHTNFSIDRADEQVDL